MKTQQFLHVSVRNTRMLINVLYHHVNVEMNLISKMNISLIVFVKKMKINKTLFVNVLRMIKKIRINYGVIVKILQI